MKNERTPFITIVLIAAQLFFGFSERAVGLQTQESAVFERTYSQKFNGITIVNTSGRTDIETWNSDRVHIMATAESGKTEIMPLSLRIRVQVNESELRIRVVERKADVPINLMVFVPRQVSLTVRGSDDNVAIKGITNALSVETESGNISLSLPRAASTDLSLRSIEGSISSQIEMRLFGPVDSHSLDAQTGRGGAPVILRSTRGSLSLIADDPGRIARADSRSVSIRTGRDPQSLANVVMSRASTIAPDESNSSGSPIVEQSPLSSVAKLVRTAASDDPPVADVIRIDSRLVNLNVRVTDSTGKLIPDLTRADFQVFENNIQQEVVRFESVNSPVSVVLLLDASGSTKERWKVIRKAAKKFIDTLGPTTPIAVAAFTRRFLVICDFSCDRKIMKERIDKAKNLQAGTAFYDATWSALNLFKDVKEQRKAIVVMTDGVDNSLSSEEYEPRHPFDELLGRMSQEEVTIYPIYFDTEYEVTVKMRSGDTHDAYVTARQQLQRIADETGGTLFKADKAEDLENVYQRVASELQTLYSVSYNPIDKNYDGQWRTVAVRVKRASAQAKTKRGFYAK